MRSPDRNTIDQAARKITDRWFLAGPGIGKGRPCIVLETRHDRERKALRAVLSYCETEQGQGYSVDTWQSDWLLLQLVSEPTKRYSAGDLQQVRRWALDRLEDPDGPQVLREVVARMDALELVQVPA